MSDEEEITNISFYSRDDLHGKHHNIGSIAGVVYVATVVPVCSAYSLQQQNEAGTLLLWVSSALLVFLLGRGAYLLAAITFNDPEEARNGSTSRSPIA